MDRRSEPARSTRESLPTHCSGSESPLVDGDVVRAMMVTTVCDLDDTSLRPVDPVRRAWEPATGCRPRAPRGGYLAGGLGRPNPGTPWLIRALTWLAVCTSGAAAPLTTMPVSGCLLISSCCLSAGCEAGGGQGRP